MDDLMVYIDDDGTLREYDDKYDVVIHCESQQEHDEVIKLLRKLKGEQDG